MTMSPPRDVTTIDRSPLPSSVLSSIDTDGGGSLDPDELKDALKQMGKKATDAEVQKMFGIADPDGTGAIDFEGFCKLIAPMILAKLKAGMISGDSNEDEVRALQCARARARERSVSSRGRRRRGSTRESERASERIACRRRAVVACERASERVRGVTSR